MNHYPTHLAAGIVLIGATLAVGLLTPNRLVRSRLRLSFALFVAFLGLDAFIVLAVPPTDLRGQLTSIEHLVLALGVIITLVLIAINPLRVDRVPERFPAIVQDAVVVALFALVATFVLREKFLTTSAVGAVVVGFALQDTLGNMFSGLAIQIEKPFRVGHWISAGEWEGAVTEVTWRATKLRTRYGNLVIVPNSEISKQAITNYSEPASPTRLHLQVGVSYGTSPGVVKHAVLEAMRKEPLVLSSPEPQIVLHDFGDSALIYRVYFWVREFALDELAYDRVRCAIYYTFQRNNIEIPYPIQIEYQRDEVVEQEAARIERLAGVLGSVELFSTLTDAMRRQLAAMCREVLYGPDQRIVTEGEIGSSAFVIESGSARVTIAGVKEPVAELQTGQYFGEMSLLTGERRTATVTAIGDCRLIEITADAFRAFVLNNSAVLDTLTAEVARRRAASAEARSAAVLQGVQVESALSLLTRVRRFLLGSADPMA
jgi:small-conductance mechanosensitive channel/CRP-like cAMP-binding protein